MYRFVCRFQAHTLFNAVAARKPDDDSWNKRAFEMQQLYWGENSKFTSDQQQSFMKDLRADLEKIRLKCRNELFEAEKLANMYERERVSMKQWIQSSTSASKQSLRGVQ